MSSDELPGEISVENCLLMGRLCASSRLRVLSRQITRHYDRFLEPVGITAAQMPIFTFLYSSRTTTISAIADALALDRSTLSRNLKVLSKRGLVKVESGAGRRPSSVQLTARGSARFSEALAAWNRAQNELKEIVDFEELGKALDTVEDLARKLPR